MATKVSLTENVGGILPVANGGTGASSIPTWNQNTTGSAATLTTTRNINGVGFNGSANITLGSTTPTASTLAQWDGSLNMSANAFLASSTSITSAGTTTTLTIASTQVQIVTGTNTQTIKLPTTSVIAGSIAWVIVNQSSGAVTVQSSGANTIATLATNQVGEFIPAVSTPTSAAHWIADVITAGKAPSFANSIAFVGTDATTMTFPGSSATVAGLGTTQTFTASRVNPRSGTVSAPGATPTLNTDNYDIYTFTGLAAAITSMTTNLSGTPVTGNKLMLGFKDAGTAEAITWGASFKSSGVATLLATTVASKQHWVGLMYDGSSWVCMAVDAVGY